MTDSQYIEVAEMWGWRRGKAHNTIWWLDGVTKQCWEPDSSALMDRINSWEGFGRTVERFVGDMKNAPKFWALIKPIIAQYLMNQAKDSIEQFFEQIHLAALEALK